MAYLDQIRASDRMTVVVPLGAGIAAIATIGLLVFSGGNPDKILYYALLPVYVAVRVLGAGCRGAGQPVAGALPELVVVPAVLLVLVGLLAGPDLLAGREQQGSLTMTLLAHGAALAVAAVAGWFVIRRMSCGELVAARGTPARAWLRVKRNAQHF